MTSDLAKIIQERVYTGAGIVLGANDAHEIGVALTGVYVDFETAMQAVCDALRPTPEETARMVADFAGLIATDG